AITVDGPHLKVVDSEFAVGSRSVYVVALGKAAFSMSVGLAAIIEDKIESGVITCPPETVNSGLAPSKWQVFSGGHPLPNESSLEAARATFALLEKASKKRGL